MTNLSPVRMEDFSFPGLKVSPRVVIGSQTISRIHGIIEEQAWEGFFYGGVSGENVGVVRDFEPTYLDYWEKLMGKTHTVNLQNTDKGEFLTSVLLNTPSALDKIRNLISSKSTLTVFLPTKLEEELATKLQIPLHGRARFSDEFGTKSGIRQLANEFGVKMSPGYICKTMKEIYTAIKNLKEKFDEIAIKHDQSFSGYFSKKVILSEKPNIDELIDYLSGGKFIEGKDIFVIEGWLKAKASLCAHIEILPGKKPILCSAWQQIIDKDGVSYMGAGPMRLSKKAMESFLYCANKLCNALEVKGATGSFGPDFLITGDDESRVEPDSCVLIELNARIPFTAVPIEIVKQVKGTVGSGFCAKHIKLANSASFNSIYKILKEKGLLITEKNPDALGVVVYNIGLLPWKLFDIVSIASTYEEALSIVSKVENIFKNELM